MVKENEAMSRYSRPCPVCGAIIRPSDIRLYGDSFPCPSCGEWLKSDSKYSYTICALSLILSGFLTWRTGYHDGMFIFITIGATIVLCLVGLFLLGISSSTRPHAHQPRPEGRKAKPLRPLVSARTCTGICVGHCGVSIVAVLADRAAPGQLAAEFFDRNCRGFAAAGSSGILPESISSA